MPAHSSIPEFLRKAAPSSSPSLPAIYPPLAMLWALRLLLMGGAIQSALSKRRHELEDFLGMLIPDINLDTLNSNDLIAQLSQILAEQDRQDITMPVPLCTNLQQLAASLGLSQTEQDIVAFLVFVAQETVLTQALNLVHSHWLGTQQLVSLLAAALEQPRQHIAQSLSPDSPLVRCGLIQIEHHGNGLELMRGLDDVLLYQQGGPNSLLQAFSSRHQACDLTLDDFSHLQPFVAQINTYLSKNLKKPQSGINILLYGAPGTGKTEFTRALAAYLSADLHEVKFANQQGEALTGRERFARYQLCQQVLRQDTQSLILFDEVEDVFNERISAGHKAWVNQLLESNPRPAFWLTNHIGEMDGAFIRRFDLVLAMPELNATVRLTIARRLLKDLKVSEPWLVQLAKQPQLQPAHLTRAAKVVKKLGYRNIEKREAAMEDLLANLYQALGFRWQRLNMAITPCLFNPALCATDATLPPIIEGLARSGMGRLCLFGPPGTGKTALARYLATKLNKPLICKKASDLLDAYVGGTEKRLAAAFTEAAANDAILFIDESDSMLASREGAVRNWEVSQVNELLVQMEQYEGILVMATNFMDNLDTAALRRFDFKIRFTYFSVDQAWQYFNNQLGLAIKQQFYEQAAAHLYPKLSLLTQLTPGDFAVVARRHKVMAETLTPDSLLAGLEREHLLKTAKQSKPIGFMAKS